MLGLLPSHISGGTILGMFTLFGLLLPEGFSSLIVGVTGDFGPPSMGEAAFGSFYKRVGKFLKITSRSRRTIVFVGILGVSFSNPPCI